MSKIDELKPYLKSFLSEYYGIKNIHRNFRCINPNHEDKHPSMSYHKDEHYVKCFSCGYAANIVGIASDYWHISKSEALEKLEEKYLNKDKKTKKTSYLSSRGLKTSTIKHFNVKEIENFQAEYIDKNGQKTSYPFGSAIIIPNGDSYIARSTIDKKFYKPLNSQTGIFFAEELDQINDPVFIVESPICAMTIWQQGCRAIALGGLGYNSLLSELEKRGTNIPPLILSLDTDTSGKKITDILSIIFDEKKYKYINYPVITTKDPNEFFLYNPKAFNTYLNECLNAINKKDITNLSANNLSEYIQNSFLSDVLKQKKDAAARLTGFKNLDKNLGGFTQGLYIVGGRPGVGKTTFLDQLSCELSAQVPVFFISYEQNRLHFAAKQIARLANLNGIELTSNHILKGIVPREIVNIMDIYCQSNREIYIYSDSPPVDEIQRRVEQFEYDTGKSPIIIVDFIQKVPSQRNNIKDAVDETVSKLQHFTTDGRRTSILVSSFNRAAYYSSVTIDSFRESGNIEYAADVMLGFQYVTQSDKLFKSDTKQNEKIEAIKKAELENPRKLELVCVKNRYGNQFSVSFDYYSDKDLFLESEQE